MKKISAALCMVVLGAALAQAGDNHKHAAAADADPMAAAKAEMAKCTVCKHLVPHMDEFGPVMTMDVANLNDGVVIVHGVSDMALVPKFQTVSAKMYEAGEATKTMSAEEVKANLCGFCQEMHSCMAAGAKMSHGMTKKGDLMVLTSSDAAIQKRLQALGAQCEAWGQSAL